MRRPHGLRRLRVELLVGETIALQRLLDERGFVDNRLLEREPFTRRLRAVAVARSALRLSPLDGARGDPEALEGSKGGRA